MLSELTVSIEEVAAALGRTPEQIRRYWRTMHKDSGFPAPLPLQAGTWRWSRVQLQIWIAANGKIEMEAGNDNAPSVVSLTNAALLERYGVTL